MRCATALLLGAALIGGCSRGGSDEEDVQRAARGYLTAFVNGDGRTACDTLTGQQKRTVVEGAAQLLPELGSLPRCEEALKKVSDGLGADEKKQLTDRLKADKPIIANVEVAGEIATGTIVGGMKIELAKSGDRWLISEGIDFSDEVEALKEQTRRQAQEQSTLIEDFIRQDLNRQAQEAGSDGKVVEVTCARESQTKFRCFAKDDVGNTASGQATVDPQSGNVVYELDQGG